MAALEVRRWRQDHVGVPRRLVDIDVDGHHELELLEGLVQLLAVRSREHRIARDGDHRTDLAFALGEDLLCHHRRRILAERLGKLAHARVPSADTEALATTLLPARRRIARSRKWEHHAAGRIEISGHDIDHVHEPRRRRAEAHRAGADAAVHACRLCVQQFIRQPADDGCLDSGRTFHRFRRERRERAADLCDPLDVCAQAIADVCATGGEDRIGERGEEERIAVRANRDPLVCVLGGLRPPRIHDDDLAATLAQRLEATGEIGCGAQAAVRLVRVRTEHQDVVRAIDVGHRHGSRRAEQVSRRDLLGQLVDRGCRKALLGTERLQPHAVVDEWRQVVRIRIADVCADRPATVTRDHSAQSLVDLDPRLVPRHGDEFTVALHERCADAVRVLVQLLERASLRTDEALREHVVAVATDARDGVTDDGDLQPARRLAEWTRAKHGAFGGCHLPIVP